MSRDYLSGIRIRRRSRGVSVEGWLCRFRTFFLDFILSWRYDSSHVIG